MQEKLFHCSIFTEAAKDEGSAQEKLPGFACLEETDQQLY